MSWDDTDERYDIAHGAEPVSTCPVACIGWIDSGQESVAERARIRAELNNLLGQALLDIPEEARVVLDTGAGAAIVFLGELELCLKLGCVLRDALAATGDDALPLRIGMHVGPVCMLRGSQAPPSFTGEGLSEGQRIMQRAAVHDVLVSKSFYDNAVAASDEYARCFAVEVAPSDLHQGQPVYALIAPFDPRARADAPAQSSTTEPAAGSATPQVRGAGMAARVLHRPRLATALAVSLILLLSVALRLLVQDGAGDPVVNRKVAVPAASIPLVAAGSDTASQPGSAQPGVEGGSATAVQVQPGVAPILDAPANSAPAVAPVVKPPTSTADTAESGAAARAGERQALPSGTVARSLPHQPNTGGLPGPESEPPDGLVALGGVRLTVVPWGEVYVDGEMVGVAPPLRTLALKPGVRRIEIRNPGFPPQLQVVEVRSGEQIRIRHRFE